MSEKPDVALVWDPELITAKQYAELVEGIGNVVRAHGGAGIKLLKSDTLATANGGTQ